MTKTEHEKLKEICDLIDYKGSLDKIMGSYDFIWGKGLPKTKKLIAKKDVREIIFAPEFMERYLTTVFDGKTDKEVQKFRIMLTHNLHDPVNYLYNKLGLND